MKRALSIFLAIIIACATSVWCRQSDFQPPRKWLEISGDELMSMGRDYIRNNRQNDSAMMCFSIVAERFALSSNPEELKLAAQALNNKGYLYLYEFYDCQQTYLALTQAKDIAETLDAPTISAYIYVNLANLYSMFSTQSPSRELLSESYTMYRKGFQYAVKAKEWPIVMICFANMTTLDNNIEDVANIPEIDRFRQLITPQNIPLTSYCHERLRALDALRNADTVLAIAHLKRQLNHIDIPQTPETYRIMALNDIAWLFEKINLLDSAIIYNRSNLDFTRKNGYIDCEVKALDNLSRIYSAKRDSSLLRYYKTQYYEKKDTMMRVSNLNAINNMHYASELNIINRELTTVSQEKEIRGWIIIFAASMLMLSIVFTVFIVNRNRNLKRVNRHLFEQHQELMRKDDELLRSSHSKPTKIPVAERTVINETRANEVCKKILEIMDNEEAIFSSDFSLSELASMIDEKPRFLSTAIGVIFGKNFYALLNSYRVKEACRRLTDKEHYGNLTIESIGKSVGYKSRQSLVTAFKTETGLTPSQYARLANEKDL